MQTTFTPEGLLIRLSTEEEIAELHDILCSAHYIQKNNFPNLRKDERDYAQRTDLDNLLELIDNLAKLGEQYGSKTFDK